MAETTNHLWFPYTPMTGTSPPFEAVATEGARIRLADGTELIDGIASWWTACHGYNHPHIAAAIAEQLARMPHVMFGGLAHEAAMRLSRRLSAHLGNGLNHVFFSDSGSVSVEVALKMAIQFWRNQGVAGRDRFVSFRWGYHGDTLGAMAVCDPEDGMHRLLGGYVPQHVLREVPIGVDQLAAFDAALADQRHDIAAVILEPLVQATGNMKFHTPETLAGIARSCARHDVLLILDEVATGFGRTGTMFAFEAADAAPDIICLSKALTGGTMGLAATVANDRVFSAFESADPDKALMHGPSYMANPLACAAANASLDLFETEPRLAQVASIENQLTEELAPCGNLPNVRNVRVRGAVGVVQLDRIADLAGLRGCFVAEGVWIRPLGDVIYLMPPLIIEPAELSTLTIAINKLLQMSI